MLAHRFQWVGVEETVAFERHTGNKTVVKGALQNIIVFRLSMKKEKAVVDIDVAYRSACLTVGAHIGQLIVLAEGLSAGSGTDAAGDVKFFANDIRPDAVDGVNICGVASEGCNIAIWKTSFFFFSPPEKPSLTDRFCSFCDMSSSASFSRLSLRNSVAAQ